MSARKCNLWRNANPYEEGLGTSKRKGVGVIIESEIGGERKKAEIQSPGRDSFQPHIAERGEGKTIEREREREVDLCEMKTVGEKLQNALLQRSGGDHANRILVMKVQRKGRTHTEYPG